MDTQCESAILSTLCYAAVFESGLTLDELVVRLHTSRPYSRSQITRGVRRLQARGLLVQEAGVVALQAKAVKSRRQKEIWSAAKRQAVIAQLSVVSWIPTVVGIGITGSVAARSAGKQDDIDFLIITAPQTLWITRLLVLLSTYRAGLLRYGKMEHTNNRWCFNLWLTTESLAMQRQSLYVAREILQIDWIVDRGACYQAMLCANRWIKRYCANASIPAAVRRPSASWGWVLPFEFLCYLLQRLHMWPAQTREVVGWSHAFFHPRDTAGGVLRRYDQLVKKTRKRYTASL